MSKPPLRVLDMACGSGSFLLGAYQCLLDHALAWHIAHKPAAHKKTVYQNPRGGDWRLTIEEKKRILTMHLFGVDIDPQAVEVTKLSLLLKALEGENDATLSLQRKLFHDRALPNLADNIKCGNSLIGPDYFVGNPPYIRIQTMKEWAPREVEIYKELFRAGRSGNHDIYVVFIEQGLKLLNAAGRRGFICPHKFFNSKYGEAVRGLIAEGKHLSHVVHFGDQQVFQGATTYTSLIFLDKQPTDRFLLAKVNDVRAWQTLGDASERIVKAREISAAEWNFTVGAGTALFEKLSRMPIRLGDVAKIFVGLQTSADPVFLFKDVPSLTRKPVSVYSKAIDERVSIETELLKPVVRSGSVGRYFASATAAVLFPYRFDEGKAILLPESVMEKSYPAAWEYLRRNMQVLAQREHGKFRPTGWYQLYPKNLELWEQPKILVPTGRRTHLHRRPVQRSGVVTPGGNRYLGCGVVH